MKQENGRFDMTSSKYQRKSWYESVYVYKRDLIRVCKFIKGIWDMRVRVYKREILYESACLVYIII